MDLFQKKHMRQWRSPWICFMVNQTPVKEERILNVLTQTDALQSSRLLPADSELHPGIWSVHRKSRSRWHREQNQEKEDIFRVERYIHGLRRLVIQHLVWVWSHHRHIMTSIRLRILHSWSMTVKMQIKMQEFLWNWYQKQVLEQLLQVLQKPEPELSWSQDMMEEQEQHREARFRMQDFRGNLDLQKLIRHWFRMVCVSVSVLRQMVSSWVVVMLRSQQSLEQKSLDLRQLRL